MPNYYTFAIKKCCKKISKHLIIDKVKIIQTFYKTKLKKFLNGILGLNPHCESIDKFNEDEKVIKPVVSILKKKDIIYRVHFQLIQFL